MPKNETDFKWTCRSCTYGNWPSTNRCVMCHLTAQNSCRTSPVPDLDISERGPDVIYNELSPSEEIICTNEKNGVTEKSLKWNCPTCSYSNWMKSVKCVMCFSLKPNEFKLVESLRNIENNGDIKNCDSRKDKKLISLTKGHKWGCLKCTYENWPKASKCIICQHPKNKNYKDDNGKLNDRKYERNVKLKKKTSSPRRSPPRSPNSVLRHSSNIFEIPKQEDETITDLSMAMEKLNTGSDNQYVNQIRNRLSKKDWIWLAACKGVADYDLSAVSSYLAMGGDRTRQLTPDDVTVLNEPGRFESGHTLVHLAIKYHREDILRMLLIPEVPHRAAKKLPCHVCPELSTTIRKQMSHSIRFRKGEFECPFFTELVTFSLPGGKKYLITYVYLNKTSDLE